MHSTRLDSARKRAESVDSLSSRRPEHSLSENLHGRIGEHRNNTQQTVWVCDDAMRHGIALYSILMAYTRQTAYTIRLHAFGIKGTLNCYGILRHITPPEPHALTPRS